ncbi:hypothetical protein E1265_21325 [Streptomyces sp. 8K308]|uniref:hypothetical protein n=1 Tax=Streptomyces sp. 8K308 TaxID=2530388 RepID=UPI00104E20F6|nr:hypothetical protein [Streptomyces sp. 8K308]TDC20614.1 hypothetical protein E1265_21325 [Streptomyces sp. 8K308]
MRQHIVDGHHGRWIAVRLSDGGTDSRHYGRRRDAVRFQLHPTQCAYVRVPRDDMSPRAAAAFLATHRRLYAAGLVLADPDDDRELILPAGR